MAIKTKETRFTVWKLIAAIISIVILICIIGYVSVMRDSGGIDLAQDVTIIIEDGWGASTIAEVLYENGIIKHPKVFRLQSKLGGFDDQLQPGAVTLHDGMSYNDILEQLSEANRDTIRVVIPEGYEAKQIQATLAEAGLPCAEEFNNALDPTLYDYRFLEGLPERDNKLEGYLFPATYEIPETFTAQEVVNLMLKSFDEVFTDEYYNRAAEMGMSVDQIITMASIIERETNATSERAKVAGVFYNRLNSGMKLQSCATVQYALSDHKPVLSIADTKINSPYNTYLNTGLPIGPISNPGAECIKAALWPENTDAYYFCLSTSGEHIFSTTYADHVKAMESNDLIMNVDTSAVENEDSKK
ncbi:MAG: endolytic transglycosylase MltG [Clostridia bacterium]|nr:endolytic transglycosylase MltG [Clostridia bacterium]